MTKRYFEKELDFSSQEHSYQFAEELKRIDEEVKHLESLKRNAKEKIPSLTKKKKDKVTNVVMVTDEKERKKVIEQRRKLQDEIEELELYLDLDIEQYRKEQQDKLVELAKLAEQEKREYDQTKNALLEKAKQEFEEKKDEIIVAGYGHPFNANNNRIASEIRKRVRYGH